MTSLIGQDETDQYVDIHRSVQRDQPVVDDDLVAYPSLGQKEDQEGKCFFVNNLTTLTGRGTCWAETNLRGTTARG